MRPSLRPVRAPKGSVPPLGFRLGCFDEDCWACDRTDARVTTWTAKRGWYERSAAIDGFSEKQGSVAGLFSRRGEIHLVTSRGAIFRWEEGWQNVASPHARLKNVILQPVYDPTRDCLVAWIGFRPGVPKKKNRVDEVMLFEFSGGAWSGPHKSAVRHGDLLDEKQADGADRVHSFDLYFDTALAAVVRLGHGNLSILRGNDWEVHELSASIATPRLVAADPASQITVLVDLWNDGQGIGDSPTGRLFRLEPAGLSAIGDFEISAKLDVRTSLGCFDPAGRRAWLLDSDAPHSMCELDLGPAFAAAAKLPQRGPERATAAPIRLYSSDFMRTFWFCDPQPGGLKLRKGLVGGVGMKEESIALAPDAVAEYGQGLACAKQREGFVTADVVPAQTRRMLLGRAAFPLSLRPIKLTRAPFDSGPVGAIGGPPPVSAQLWPKSKGRAMTCLLWFQTVGLFNDVILEDVHGVAVFAEIADARVRAVEAVGVGESIYRQRMPAPQASPLFATIELYRGDGCVELSDATSGFLRSEDPLMAKAWESLGRDERERRLTNKLGGVVEGASNDKCRAMLALDLRGFLSGRAEAQLAPCGLLRVFYDPGKSQFEASWVESP